jgi:hypothetical protein
MVKRNRRGIRILFLAAFVAVTLGVNFAHTETGVAGRDDCPACHFLSSSLSTSPGAAFLVPELLYQETLPVVEPGLTDEIFLLSFASRSPPQA